MPLKLILVVTAAFLMGAVGALALIPPKHNILETKIRSTGKAAIGGAFTLTDHTGKQVTEKDFRGKYSLVYFGFTFCPDVCPSELQVISEALNLLGDKAQSVTPVFISVDPDRDTVEQMASYVSNFHPSLVGLTGTHEQIKAAARAYRVYYKKVDDEMSSDGYSMDHSAIVYLMNADGEYVSHFSYGTKPKDMAKKLLEVIG